MSLQVCSVVERPSHCILYRDLIRSRVASKKLELRKLNTRHAGLETVPFHFATIEPKSASKLVSKLLPHKYTA